MAEVKLLGEKAVLKKLARTNGAGSKGFPMFSSDQGYLIHDRWRRRLHALPPSGGGLQRPSSYRRFEKQGEDSEVSPRSSTLDQRLAIDLIGNKCTHGAVFKVTRPEEGLTATRASEVLQRCLADALVRCMPCTNGFCYVRWKR